MLPTGALQYDACVTADYQTSPMPFPRFPLATFPSPLERAERFEQALRTDLVDPPRIYLKRDDMLSLGLGGNKIRNLEFAIGQALDEGATDIVTAGRQQSNHCRLTAAACARAALASHLVFTGGRPKALTGNLLLDDLLGAQLYFADTDARADRESLVEATSARLRASGKRPFVIPLGGSDARGAFGHALAALELASQMRVLGEARWSVLLATATGGTQAGMLAGLGRLDPRPAVTGFAVAKDADELRADVHRLAQAVATQLGARVDAADVVVEASVLGGGYGAPTSEARTAIELLARTEGVFADPVYTGKALAGLIALVRNGRFAATDAVVFLHTGGAPALFA